MTKRRLSNAAPVIIPVVAFIAFVLFWQVACRLSDISPLILPTPVAVSRTLFAQAPYLAFHSGMTLIEAVCGFLLGTAIAVALAVLFQFSLAARLAFYPYVIGFKAIPLVAMAPIVVVWFGTGLMSKVFLAAVISFFPVLVSTVHGLNSVEPEELDLMATFSATRWQVLTKLRVPMALDSFFAGAKVSSTFAVIGAVVAEFVGADRGIGYIIKSSSYYLDTDLTFAAIVASALVGLLFFWAVSILHRLVVFWKHDSDDTLANDRSSIRIE